MLAKEDSQLFLEQCPSSFPHTLPANAILHPTHQPSSLFPLCTSLGSDIQVKDPVQGTQWVCGELGHKPESFIFMFSALSPFYIFIKRAEIGD